MESTLKNALRIGGLVIAAAMLLLAILYVTEDKMKPLTPDEPNEALVHASSRVGLVFP